jgi:OmpA-OmpF porin, OOP family
MRKLFILLLIPVAIATFGCSSGTRLHKSSLIEQKRLESYKERGADQCAPHDLAMAESYVEFMLLELDNGDYLSADKYLDKKDFHAARAGVNAESCFAKDRDNDGIPDSEDRCPDDPGPSKFKGCPDKDGDGIPDIDDKCPDQPGLPELNGCPPAADRDNDGVPDTEDRCPEDPGAPELRGCPDRDGDGIPDIDDKCPDQPGSPELNGCPPATDRDNDGVPDTEDRCPEDPGPLEFRGCPDKDGDGIPDIDDKCPDQPGPAELNGCPPAADRDGDGIPDSEDRCPDDPGTKEYQGCPDRDGDGIPDIDDRCPDDAGPVEFKGCPDKDGDGIPDIDDRCPDDAGSAEFKGCPDKDDDGIPDIDDKCPDVKGVKEHEGCPPPKQYKMIIVTEKEIELKQTVFFQTGKAVIEKKSYDLLKEVADAIINSPKIKKVYIEGHTDNVGNRNLNLRLSQQRADSVRDFLIEEGVDAKKLDSKGFGPDKPVQSNRTKQGRAKNRRVEFRLEQ